MFARTLISNLKPKFNLVKKINFSNKFLFSFQKLSFSTNNDVKDKETLEMITAGVFEVLKSFDNVKQDKLSINATFEELGKII
jgi:hypothetical protein